jgi:ankyrin repeat protein
MNLDMLRTLLALEAAATAAAAVGRNNPPSSSSGRSVFSAPATDYPTRLFGIVRTWKEPRHKEDMLVDALRTHLSASTPSPPIDATDGKGRTALFYLVKARHNRAARFLVENGADPLLEDAKGISPLFLACLGIAGEEGVGTIAFIDAAITHLKSSANRVADIDRILNRHLKNDSQSASMLFVALRALAPGRGGLALLDVVLSHGADPNATAPNGLTPLHAAIVGESTAALLALLHHGARIDVPKADGATPLHFAVLRDQPMMVGLLLIHGADPLLRFGQPKLDDLPYWQDKTAADLAFIEGNKLMADAIREYKTLWEAVPRAQHEGLGSTD